MKTTNYYKDEFESKGPFTLILVITWVCIASIAFVSLIERTV